MRIIQDLRRILLAVSFVFFFCDFAFSKEREKTLTGRVERLKTGEYFFRYEYPRGIPQWAKILLRDWQTITLRRMQERPIRARVQFLEPTDGAMKTSQVVLVSFTPLAY